MLITSTDDSMYALEAGAKCPAEDEDGEGGDEDGDGDGDVPGRGSGLVDVDGRVELSVNPREEWFQIFDEAVNTLCERSFVPSVHFPQTDFDSGIGSDGLKNEGNASQGKGKGKGKKSKKGKKTSALATHPSPCRGTIAVSSRTHTHAQGQQGEGKGHGQQIGMKELLKERALHDACVRGGINRMLQYRPLVAKVGSRAELSDVLSDAFAELGISHVYEDEEEWDEDGLDSCGRDLAGEGCGQGYLGKITCEI
jgi:hypothetical protein